MVPSADSAVADADLVKTRPKPTKQSRFTEVRGQMLAILILCGWVALWEALSRLGLLNPFFFPRPSKIAMAAVELASDGFPDGILVEVHILATLKRVVCGFLLAAGLGVPLGIIIGYMPALDRIFSNIITFGRSIAAISILPLFIAWFGIGEASKIALITFAAFWVSITYTIAGVKFVDPVLLRAARSMDCSTSTIFWSVILPAALPRIFAGLKLSLGVAFLVIVASEMIATVEGLGALIQEARTSFRTDITMLGMLIIGVLGYGLACLLDVAEHRLMPWYKSMRAR
jgi:ABC-type nitrate/sulfonate/bicarbonate transport system permease component